MPDRRSFASTSIPTIDAAREALRHAYADLAEARATTKSDPDRGHMKLREAAEKGWLAAYTAGRAVIYCSGDPDWETPSYLPKKIREVEDRLGRRRGFARAVTATASTLHGDCFYRDAKGLCDPGIIEDQLKDLERVLPIGKRICDLSLHRGR